MENFKGQKSVKETFSKSFSYFENNPASAPPENWFKIAASGDSAEIVKIMKKNVNINFQDISGSTALHFAASKGAIEVLSILCTQADLNVQNNLGLTPLMSAASSGQLETVRALLSSNCDVKITDGSGLSVIHHAAISGVSDILTFLHASGMDIETRDPRGWRPLMFASKIGHVGMIATLIDLGADVDATNNFGQSSLDIARSFNRTAVISLIRRARHVLSTDSDSVVHDDVKSESKWDIVVSVLRSFHQGETEKADMAIKQLNELFEIMQVDRKVSADIISFHLAGEHAYVFEKIVAGKDSLDIDTFKIFMTALAIRKPHN